MPNASQSSTPVNETPVTKPSKLVRYPTSANALRGLLDDGASAPGLSRKPSLPTLIVPGGGERSDQSAAVRSKPSQGALTLLAGLTGSKDYEAYATDASRPRGLPRLEPVTLEDGASLGDLVRIRRQMMKLSQQHLADLAGVGRRFVGELEAGKPTVELGKTLAACRALGLTLSLRATDVG